MIPAAERPCLHGYSHEWTSGTCYVYCANCGLVDAGPKPKPPATQATARGVMWQRKVASCWRRDGPGCFYCRGPLTFETAVLDHFIPTSRGGRNGQHNRRVACRSCDQRKGNRMPWEFMPYRFAAPPLETVAPSE